MKRKITDLEQKLINDGWILTTKYYTGKHSEKTLCYEYYKTMDLMGEDKKYGAIIKLDQKRSQIVNFGIPNVSCDLLDDSALCEIRLAYHSLKFYVEKFTKEEKNLYPFNDEEESNEKVGKMTFEQFDELCKEKE